MEPLKAVANNRLGVAATDVFLADARFPERTVFEAVSTTAGDAVPAELTVRAVLAIVFATVIPAHALAENTAFTGRAGIPARSAVLLGVFRVPALSVTACDVRIVRGATRAVAARFARETAPMPVAAGIALGTAAVVTARFTFRAADGDFHRVARVRWIGIDDAEVARVVIAVALAARVLAVLAVVLQHELAMAGSSATWRRRRLLGLLGLFA